MPADVSRQGPAGLGRDRTGRGAGPRRDASVRGSDPGSKRERLGATRGNRERAGGELLPAARHGPGRTRVSRTGTRRVLAVGSARQGKARGNDAGVVDAPATPSDLPLSVLQYATRTRKPLLIDDSRLAADHPADLPQLRSHPSSLLCIPLVQQEKLAGVVYLENELARDAFPPERIALLEILASQAAVALENARLYAELEDQISEKKRAGEAL